MKKYFAAIAGGQIHYRRVGQGPAVLLLPPLPRTAQAQGALISRLAAHFTVIAVDPPGYGLSDPLPQDDRGLAPFIEPLEQLLDAFGLPRVAVVGEGAGAQLALAFAAARPGRAGVCVISAPEPAGDAADLDARFPDVAPRRDGGHLLTLWDMVDSAYLFAPWNAVSARQRLARDMPPPQALHVDFLDFLRAGAAYARIPRAAAEATIPDPLPSHVYRIEGAGQVRDEAIAACLLREWAPRGPAPTRVPEAVDAGAPRLQKQYVDLEHGQVFARVCWAGAGRSILGLHDPAGASRRLEAFVAPYVGDRPVIVPDLPGSGESDPFAAADGVTVEGYAAVVEAMLAQLGIAEVDVIGRYSGGQIGMALSLRRPGLVRRLIQAGVMIFDDADREEHLAHYTPSIGARWDGSHLVTAWRAFGRQTLFWPWYNATAQGVVWRDSEASGAGLHRRLEDVFKVGDGYQRAYAASFRYPTAERLNQLAIPCLITDMPATGSYARVAQLKAAAPACQAADLPEDPAAWRGLFDAFLA